MDVPKPRLRVESRVGEWKRLGTTKTVSSSLISYQKTVDFSHNEGLLQVVYAVLEYEPSYLIV